MSNPDSRADCTPYVKLPSGSNEAEFKSMHRQICKFYDNKMSIVKSDVRNDLNPHGLMTNSEKNSYKKITPRILPDLQNEQKNG